MIKYIITSTFRRTRCDHFSTDFDEEYRRIIYHLQIMNVLVDTFWSKIIHNYRVLLRTSNTRNPEDCRMRVQFLAKISPVRVRSMAKIVKVCYRDNFPTKNRRVKRKIFSTSTTSKMRENSSVVNQIKPQ